MPIGTLLYQTSAKGLLYGKNTNQLVEIKNGILKRVNCGHVGIYVGQDEKGADMVVEAVAKGVVMDPLKYFVNLSNGSRFLGAKIPKNSTKAQRQAAAQIAKALAKLNLKYDFDFRQQKGPNSGDWICVGLTEKVYESADPNKLQELERAKMSLSDNPRLVFRLLSYNPSQYSVNITPDGYDDKSIFNQKTGDVFSKKVEYSKISKRKLVILPLPEIFGTNCGKEYQDKRYFFLPFTQYLQPSLKDVELSPQQINKLQGYFSKEIEEKYKGKVPLIKVALLWTKNDVVSTTHNVARKTSQAVYYVKAKVNRLVGLVKKQSGNFLHQIISFNQANQMAAQKKAISSITKRHRQVQIRKDKKLEAPKKQVKKSRKTIKLDKDKIAISKKAVDSKRDKKQQKAKQLSQKIKDLQAKIKKLNRQKEKAKRKLAKTKKEATTTEFLPKILISEVCSGFDSSKNEFIELYNPNNKPINLDKNNLQLILVNSHNKQTIKKLKFNNHLMPSKGHFLLASQDNLESGNLSLEPDAIFSAQLTRVSGVILKAKNGDIVDKVAWGSSKLGPPESAVEGKGKIIPQGLKTGKSLERTSQAGKLIDTNDNSKDFVLSINPNPTNSKEKTIVYQPKIVQSKSNNASTGFSLAGSLPSASNTQAKSPKILISEVQIQGQTASNDFVELYNPNNQAVDISGWQIKKKSKTGSESSIIKFKSGSFIPANSYFLWANSKDDFAKSVQADASTTAYLAPDNSLALFDKNKNIVDALSFGTSTNPFREGKSFPFNPAQGKSLGRKIDDNGNYIDTDNNSSDFQIDVPTPKAKNKPYQTEPDLNQNQAKSQKPNLVISEIKTQGSEYVEIFNQENKASSLNGLFLAYFSSKKDWNQPTKVWQLPDSVKINPLSHFLISIFVPQGEQISFDWQVQTKDGKPYSRGQVANDGAIGIFSCNPKIATSTTINLEQAEELAKSCKIDLVGFNQTKLSEGKPANFSDKDKSLSRKIVQNTQGNFTYQDTDNNLNDFQENEPTPGIINNPLLDLDKDDLLNATDSTTTIDSNIELPPGQYQFRNLVITKNGQLTLLTEQASTSSPKIQIEADNLNNYGKILIEEPSSEATGTAKILVKLKIAHQFFNNGEFLTNGLDNKSLAKAGNNRSFKIQADDLIFATSSVNILPRQILKIEARKILINNSTIEASLNASSSDIFINKNSQILAKSRQYYLGQEKEQAQDQVVDSQKDIFQPDSFGEVGQRYGARGGGKIKVLANNLDIEGIVSASGDNGKCLSCNYNPDPGGGNGGSIWITTQNLSGTGKILAQGGNAFFAQAGNGGNIAIYYQNMNDFSGQILANGGQSGYKEERFNGKVGTIYLKNQQENLGDLIFDNNGILGTAKLPNQSFSFQTIKNLNSSHFILPENLSVTNFLIASSTVEVLASSTTSTIVIINDFSLQNGSLSAQPLYFLDITAKNLSLVASSTIEANVKIKADNLLINSSSKISANGKGYSAEQGPGKGKVRSGAGYGGRGGNSGSYAGGSTYGTSTKPTYFGSGGGNDNSYGGQNALGGNGGGIINIQTNNLRVNGTISSNGLNGSNVSEAGGGSGGSILIKTNVLAGKGYILANGGDSYGGAGSGGRVAIFYHNKNNFQGHIFAQGGKNKLAQDHHKKIFDGQDGTIFLKQE